MSNIIPSIKRHTYFTLQFSPDVTILLADKDINYDNLLDKLKNHETKIELCDNLKINIKAGLITLRGVQLDSVTWIVREDSETSIMIPVCCKEDTIRESLEYMYHLHMSTHH